LVHFGLLAQKQSRFVFNRPGRKLKTPLATHTPSIWTRRKNRENFVDATASNCQTACVKTVEQSFVFGIPLCPNITVRCPGNGGGSHA
jgi:hypothetical protein